MKTRNALAVIAGIILMGGSPLFLIWQAAYLHHRGAAGFVFTPYPSGVKPSDKSLRWLPGIMQPGEVRLVAYGSPAARAGIALEDRILAINGIPISDLKRLNDLDAATRVGDTVVYQVDHLGSEQTVAVHIESPLWPGRVAIAALHVAAGLIFWCVGWLLFVKKRHDRRVLVIYWMSLLSGAYLVTLPGLTLLLEGRLGWPEYSAQYAIAIQAIVFTSLAIILIPLTLHLALVFPKEHRILAKYPTAIRWVYAFVPFTLLSMAMAVFAMATVESIHLRLVKVLIWLAAIAVLVLLLRTRYRVGQPQSGWAGWLIAHPFRTFLAELLLIGVVVQAAAETLRVFLTAKTAGFILGLVGGLGVSLVLFLGYFVLYPLATCWALFTTYRSSNVEERQQAKWPLWGVFVSLGGKVLLMLLSVGLFAVLGVKAASSVSMQLVQESLSPVLWVLIPLSFAVAVLKFRLMNIDLIIKRTVLYSLLTGIIGALYLGLILGLGTLLVHFTGIRGEQVTITATVVVAAAVLPIRTRVMRIVEQRFFYKRREYPQRLKILRQEMLEAGSLASLLNLVVAGAQQALNSRTVVFFSMDEAGVLRAAAQSGLAEGIPESLSLSPGSPAVEQLHGLQEVSELSWPEEDLKVLQAAGSQLLAAVRFKGELLGFLGCGFRLSGEVYDIDDREFLTLLAEEAAASIDNQRLQEQERDFEKGREIQQALLPKHFPSVAGYSIAGAWQPARSVSGDYYDAFLLADGKLAMCIADVAGKGLAAALLMSNLQAAVKSVAAENVNPRDLCRTVNRVICGNVVPGRYITFFYAVLDTQARRLVYTNCGHNYPLVVRADGNLLRLKEGGSVLGIDPNFTFTQEEIGLAPGDRLLLFTDGVSEAANAEQEEFGEVRLTNLLTTVRDASAESLQLRVMSEVTRFCANRFHDDATVVAMVVE